MTATALTLLMRETRMTREQILRAVATGYGRFPPDTFARLETEADERLVNLFRYMREQRRMIGPRIETAEEAGQLRRLIQKHAPVDTGALRDSFDDPLTVQILPTGRVEIDNPLPYARIQDLGGTIHRTSPRGKPYTIVIKAQHYVGKAIAEYNRSKAGKELPVSQVNIVDYGQQRIAALIASVAQYMMERGT